MFFPLLVFWALCGAVGAMIGDRKGMAGQGLVMGFVLGPIGIVLALTSTGNRRACPYCRELVDPAAVVCAHCRRGIVPVAPAPMSRAEVAPVVVRRLLPRWAKALILVVLIGGTIAFFAIELSTRRQ
mgnify:CR=1 FL=1